jgi:hypothetical protein|tara:strand:+ start:509 stop:976 length:468 start_codon:yes stop_codon:yes gene_type:complete
MNFVKHLIECQCTLKIYKNKSKPIFHKFQVFSKIENEKVVEKYVMCNNCDILHKVTETFKSEIQWGKESLKSLVNNKEDIKFNLISKNKRDIVDLLEINDIDISDWELVEHLIENKEEGRILLSREEIENNIVYKLLYIEKDHHRIKTEITQRYV